MNEWKKALIDTLIHQLKTMFKVDAKRYLSPDVIERALRHSQECKKHFELNSANGIETCGLNEISIRPYHSLEYTCFLYWLSHELFIDGEVSMASWIYYLNKSLNCVELFYEVKLPDIWWCEHPLGSVIGRAEFGDYFFFYQGCTVGANFKQDGSAVYPVFGNHVKMLSNSKVLGDSHIGNNVIISANCYVKDAIVPDNTIVFGESPNLTFKDNYFVNGCKVDNILSR